MKASGRKGRLNALYGFPARSCSFVARLLCAHAMSSSPAPLRPAHIVLDADPPRSEITLLGHC